MNSSRISITNSDLDQDEDRFQRFTLIGWWNQERLAEAKILVVGAGALGNELIKNLAMLGVGNLLVADMDTIENSNLSRSVLFRAEDNGKPKAEVAAKTARDIYPDIHVQPFCGNVVHDLGLGAFRWADIVLGGLDNREARLAINRNCWKLGKPWIDGAIEQIQGCVRFFEPDGPCYECTMSERDWEILQLRRSCNLLTKEEMQGGRTPTTPTISSVVAGVQCQEAVKYLHQLPTMRGKGWVFEGLSGDSYTVEYQRKEECYSHDMLDEVITLDAKVADVTAADLLREARTYLGESATLAFAREMVERLDCPQCGDSETVFKSVSQLQAGAALCPSCNGVRREVITFHQARGDEAFIDRPLAELGVPKFDIVFAVGSERQIGLELSGDSGSVLGYEEQLEWV